MPVYVLVEYDRNKAQTVSMTTSDNFEPLSQKRLEMELKHRGHPNMEIVILVANELNDLRLTHSKYFKCFL